MANIQAGLQCLASAHIRQRVDVLIRSLRTNTRKNGRPRRHPKVTEETTESNNGKSTPASERLNMVGVDSKARFIEQSRRENMRVAQLEKLRPRGSWRSLSYRRPIRRVRK